MSNETEPQAGSRDRLSAGVAVVIAFTTLVAAVAGFLLAESANQANDRRKEAEQLSLQALASAQSSQQAAQVELETFARWVEQRTQAGNALLASLYAGSDPTRANSLLLEQQRWEAVAEATLRLSDIDPQSEFGPENDPTFPTRYFAAATEDSLRLNALQDAANEEASRLDQRAAGYTAILATLAVSLYLLGLTLAVSGRWLQLGFLSVGLVLVGVGVFWMVQTIAAPSYETQDEAAAEYARARVATATAFDSAGFQAAEAHYDRAIELRPSFARAYAERAGAIFLAATPQRSGFASLAPPEALARARTDLEAARALGLENAATLGSLGFYGFAEGVQEADTALLNQSIEHTRGAIALDPGEPIYRYNLGVTLVAAGRMDEARAAYQDAVVRTLYVGEDLTQLRQEPIIEEYWLAGALTDLEIVLRYRQDLRDQIRGFKEQIVGRVTAQSPAAPAGSPAVFADIELNVFPAQLQWQGNVQDYDATRDSISAQWYHQDAQGLGWAVIPQVSVADTPTPREGGGLFQLSPYLSQTVPPACLPPGQYRVELYINGRLAAEASRVADFGTYDAFLARDLTMGLCRPHDWQRREDRLPGLVDGYQSPDGLYGAYGARYGLPGSWRQFEAIADDIADVTVDSFATWFPAPPTYVEGSGTTGEYFMALNDTAWREYDYGSGMARVGAGLTDDGAVLVGIVYGPYEWFDGPEPYRILDSMIHLE